LTEPPKDAEFFEAEDIPLTKSPDGTWLAWRPEPAPFNSFRIGAAAPIDRKEWDEYRASWVSFPAN
jgi:hypothetical protein